VGGAPISEETALEPRAAERGAYTRAKLESEQRVKRAVAEEGLRAVILRPGLLFDDRGPLAGGAVARCIFGRWVVLGDGELRLPLVYLDDVVDAIFLAAHGSLSLGEVVQLVDGGGLTQNQVLDALGVRGTIHVSRGLLFALGAISEWGLRLVGRASPLARYRLRSGLAKVSFHSERAGTLLGWTPRVGVVAGLARVRSRV
jgi:nucleoside-diphosphate-sugar epimerase